MGCPRPRHYNHPDLPPHVVESVNSVEVGRWQPSRRQVALQVLQSNPQDVQLAPPVVLLEHSPRVHTRLQC